MCMYSMVYDQYKPIVPQWNQSFDWVPTSDYWTKILESFQQAKEAAQKFDEATGQKGCVDPEKAKLEERIALLEKMLHSALKLEAGEYSFHDGKVWKLVELDI